MMYNFYGVQHPLIEKNLLQTVEKSSFFGSAFVPWLTEKTVVRDVRFQLNILCIKRWDQKWKCNQHNGTPAQPNVVENSALAQVYIHSDELEEKTFHLQLQQYKSPGKLFHMFPHLFRFSLSFSSHSCSFTTKNDNDWSRLADLFQSASKEQPEAYSKCLSTENFLYFCKHWWLRMWNKKDLGT